MTRVSAHRGDLSSGRAFRLAVSLHAVALWLAPVELDGRTHGGDDDLLVVHHPVRTLADAEGLAAVLTAVAA